MTTTLTLDENQLSEYGLDYDNPEDALLYINAGIRFLKDHIKDTDEATKEKCIRWTDRIFDVAQLLKID